MENEMKACFGARVFQVPGPAPTHPLRNPGGRPALALRPSPEPVIAGRLTIERNMNGQRTGHVPEIFGEWAIAIIN